MNSGSNEIKRYYEKIWKCERYKNDIIFFILSTRNIRPKGNENKKRVTGLQTPALSSLTPMQIITSPNKKTHQRSQSDATGLFQTLRRSHSGRWIMQINMLFYYEIIIIEVTNFMQRWISSYSYDLF